MEEALEQYKSSFEMLRLETLFTGEYDGNNAVLTLHPGAGGTEAQDWGSMLFRMYMRWGEATKRTFAIGDSLKVLVADVKIRTGQIEFLLG